MKKLTSLMAILLTLCTLVSSVPVFAAVKGDDMIGDGEYDYDFGGLNTYAINQEAVNVETPSSYSYNGYKTYTSADSTLMWTLPNTTEGGTSCTAVQGMNVGTTYCYVAKRNSNDTYADIWRINMDTGAKTEMSYYSSLTATSTSSNNTLYHANELNVVTIGGVNYMFAATCVAGPAMSRYKIDGTALRFTGFFKMVTTSGSSVTISAMRHVKTSGGYLYFLIKRANYFYTCRIPENATGGSASNPTEVTIYRIFTIDTRNAVFATSNSAAGTISTMDDWTNQGFGYNKSEKVLYVPIWDGLTGNRNVVITYNLKDIIDSKMESSADSGDFVHPTVTSFMFTDTSVTSFEIESCNFRTGQGTDGDLRLYYNINCNNMNKEAVYACNYKSGSGNFTPITQSSGVVWTTKYNANGGDGSITATKHIKGIVAPLRANEFTRTGYTFAGWYLHRKSDNKWLYFKADGGASWYVKGTQPAGAKLALYENKRSVSQLTAVNGDTITCYAQWTPNSTGTKSFYIQYDANGGTGNAIADTKVVYGTTTTTAKNTFTREGYVFTGWIAHRRSADQWAYKVASTKADIWHANGDDTTGKFLKTYSNGCTVAGTSSVDRDIVTFYAAWARVKDGVYPTSLKKGAGFTLGGTVESDGGMYSLTVSITNSSGTTISTKTVNPYAGTYNLSAISSSFDFSTLDVGSYNYKVQIETLNGSAPTQHTLLDKVFEVEANGLELKDDIAASGNYDLGEQYFKGFGAGMQTTEFKALFKYDVQVFDLDGKEVGDTGRVGTGFTVTCEGDTRTAVLMADLNGDAMVSSVDYITLQAVLKSKSEISDAAKQAADVSGDGVTTAADCLGLKTMLQ